MKSVATVAVLLFAAAAGFGQNPVGFATGQSARLVIGQPEFDSESDNATQTIVGATSGLAFANDTLFVADSNLMGAAPVNNRVVLFNGMSQQLPATNAALQWNSTCPVCLGTGSLVLGQSNWTNTLPAPCVPPPVTVTVTTTPTTPTCLTTSPQTPIATGMRVPTAVASDGTHLAVADTLNNRVLIWNEIPTSMNQPPDVVVGQSSFTTASFPGDTPTASALRGPQGVWLQNGMLFVADSQYDRVLIYNSIPTSNGAAADVVLGQPNMTSWVQTNVADQTTSSTAGNMLTPVSVTSDGTKLYVTDLGFNRILIWNTIPTTNGQTADVEIGQPNMTTAISNDAFTCQQAGVAVTCGTAAVNGNNTLEVPAMCNQQVGVDANDNPTYPSLCASTLSFPRYALSDGQHLYVADGGNDRVLIFNTIPTADAASADVVLGQTDFVSDAPTDGADTMDAPSSLAFDGANLYVADTYNQRILVYTTAEQDLPYNGVRNAASLTIFAYATIKFSGTVKSGEKITVTIGNTAVATTETYNYTVTSSDSFAEIVDAFVGLINGGKDPNVLATPDTVADEVVLTAKVPGVLGNNVTLSISESNAGEVTATASGTSLTGGASTAILAPGSLVSFLGTNLSDQTATAPAGTAPTSLGGVQVYFNGVPAPLLYVSPTQINAQMPFTFQYANTNTATAWVRIQRNDGTIVATDTVAAGIVPANPGIFAGPGTPQPALAYHASSYATGVISVDGSVKAGDTGAICIASSSAMTATTGLPTGCSGRLYAYRVQDTDSLYSVQQAFVKMMAQDPDIIATASSEFTRILLQARQPGPSMDGFPYTAAVSTGANLLLTAIGPPPPSPGVGATLCCASTEGAPLTVGDPAIPGETIIIYATGLGVPYLDPALVPFVTSGTPYLGSTFNAPPQPQFVSSLVDGSVANVLRAELLPGAIGIYQLYLQLNSQQATDPLATLTIAQSTFLSNPVTIPVLSVPLLSGIACDPDSLLTGDTSTCTVTLSVSVPNAATTITLTSSDTLGFPVPANLVIPAGSTSASFTVNAELITAVETVTITATLGTSSAQTTVTLNP